MVIILAVESSFILKYKEYLYSVKNYFVWTYDVNRKHFLTLYKDA